MKDNFQGNYFKALLLLFQKFRRKSARIELEFIFLVSQKIAIYKILNNLKLFWFTIDSSVLLNEGESVFLSWHLLFFVSIANCIKLYKRIK